MKCVPVICAVALCMLLTSPSVEGQGRSGGRGGGGRRGNSRGGSRGVAARWLAFMRGRQARVNSGGQGIGQGGSSRCKPTTCSDGSTTECPNNQGCRPLPTECLTEGQNPNSPTSYCTCSDNDDCDPDRTTGRTCFRPPASTGSGFAEVGFCIQAETMCPTDGEPAVYCPKCTRSFSNGGNGGGRGSGRRRYPTTTTTTQAPGGFP